MASRFDECQKISNFSPAERRRMQAESGVEDLEGQVRFQKLITTDAKTGKVLEDIRLAKLWRQSQDYLVRKGDTPANRKRALSNVLVRSLTDDVNDISIEAAGHGINRMYVAKLGAVAEDIKPTRLGWKKQQTLMDDLSAELHGKKSGNAKAKTASVEIRSVLEDLRLRFNRAGGKIVKLGDWAMPHGSSQLKMSKATQLEYIDRTLPLINKAKMRKPWGEAMSDADIRETLGLAYNEIVGVGEAGPSKSIANKYQEHRELHFSDYQAYAKEFGDENTWKVLTDHIERMSREISLLERLGNNPRAAFTKLQAQLGVQDNHTLDALYKNLAGFARPDKNVFTQFGATIRPALSSAQLGSALLSSLADVGTASVNAAFNGMSWTRMLKQLSATSEGRAFATRIGASIDHALDNVGISQRFDDVAGGSWSQKAADTVFRASGLSAWTNMLRRAHAMEFAQTLAEHAGKKLSDVEPRFRSMLESYGVTEAEWRSIGGGKKLNYKGAEYLDMPSIADEGAQVRIMAIMAQEQDLGVIMPDVRTKAVLNQGLDQDTALGQGIRSFAQYKSFGVSVTMNNLFRYMASKRLNTASRVGYTTALVVSTTLLGALSVQLKLIAKGKDPREMGDEKFWLAAAAQGGGAGLIGDFLFAESTRYGNSALATALGPTGSAIEDVYKIGKSVVEGEPDIARAARYVPGQSMWYARAVYERVLVDQLELFINPRSARKRARSKIKSAKTRGTPYYYEPGSVAPKRAPDLGRMLDVKKG